MLRKSLLAACFAALAVPAAANNKEHVVVILPDAFFPEVSYIDPGDSVRFVNARGSSVRIYGADEAWETTTIPAQGQFVMTIGAGQATEFFDDNDQSAEETALVQGTLTFDPAPLVD